MRRPSLEGDRGTPAPSMPTPKYRLGPIQPHIAKAARDDATRIHADPSTDDIEIQADACVTRSADNGFWVAAWVHVRRSALQPLQPKCTSAPLKTAPTWEQQCSSSTRSNCTKKTKTHGPT